MIEEQVKIICPSCKMEFYQNQFNEDNAADSCQCGNLQLGIKKLKNFVQHKFWVTCTYNKEKPVVEFIDKEKNS